uniref:Putative single-stranded DNA-binding protein n=1 Tax=viral metagenome TaxID=1070528 RepID=A0A6M3L9A8_9ZZZZ
MPSLNRATIIGHLGADAEVRFTPSGNKVVNFRVATNEGKNKDGEERPPEWHSIVCWKYAADRAEGFKKGDCVYVEGKLQTRSWEDDQGAKRFSTEIVGWQVAKIEREPKKDRKPDAPQPGEDDIPF